MNKQNKQIITKDMDEVIATSKKVRDFLGNQDLPLEERSAELQTFKTVLDANKNIVSASSIKINVDKLGRK